MNRLKATGIGSMMVKWGGGEKDAEVIDTLSSRLIEDILNKLAVHARLVLKKTILTHLPDSTHCFQMSAGGADEGSRQRRGRKEWVAIFGSIHVLTRDFPDNQLVVSMTPMGVAIYGALTHVHPGHYFSKICFLLTALDQVLSQTSKILLKNNCSDCFDLCLHAGWWSWWERGIARLVSSRATDMSSCPH